MGKKNAVEPIGAPSTDEPEFNFAELWDSFEPGQRISRGVYSIFKTDDGGMHISYRAVRDDDADELRDLQQRQEGEDSHMPIPGMMVQMMIAAGEGKGPLGRMAALVKGRFSG